MFLEKHWRSVISRSVCDYYLEAQRTNGNDINPVIATPHHYLISIQRGGVSFVAVCKEEISPLFAIEFLHRIVDIFQESIIFNLSSSKISFKYFRIIFPIVQKQ